MLDIKRDPGRPRAVPAGARRGATWRARRRAARGRRAPSGAHAARRGSSAPSRTEPPRRSAAPQGDEKQALIAEVAKVSAELKELEPELAEAEAALTLLLASTPNLPHPSAPDGFTDEDARRGQAPSASRRVRLRAEGPRRRWARRSGMLDVERAVRTSGSRFVYLMGDLVFVQFALMRHAMDILVERGLHAGDPAGARARGGHVRHRRSCPTPRGQIYRTDEDDLYLVGTSEVPGRAAHRTRSWTRARSRCGTRATRPASGARPARTARTSAGCSACTSSTRWRCSASSTPERSWDEHECLLGIEERIIGDLEIPYRVVNIAAGDLGGRPRKKYDIEALAARPGALPRADVVLEHHRLPGPPHADADAPRRRRHRRRCTPSTARHGDRPDADRDHGEPPAGRRLGRARPAKLHPYLPERLRELTPRRVASRCRAVRPGVAWERDRRPHVRNPLQPGPPLEDGLARLKGPIVDGDERGGAIRALEEAERRYRQLVETIPPSSGSIGSTRRAPAST